MTQAQDLGFIHRWVPKPGADVTVLLLHGTGGDENDLLPLGQMVAPSANLLSPRGKVLENGMPRFFRRLAVGVFDVPDLKQRSHELAAFVGDAARAYGFDPARVVALGLSNGANIAAALLLLHPTLLAGAALLRAMPPFDSDPVQALVGRPVLIAAGRQDPYVSVDQAEALAALLRRSGADVTIHWSDGGHAIDNDAVRATREWFARHFGD